MKIQRPAPDRFVLQLSSREQKLLFETIKLYPLVHASHHRLTRAANAQSEENQRLLEASLAEQRTENRRQIEALLNDPHRLQKRGRSFHLELKPGECEWMLQVLNDVYVGSWIALGELDEDKQPQITEENLHFETAMAACDKFQSLLLAALGETESPEWLG